MNTEGRIFSWEDFDSWKTQYLNLFDQYLTSEVIQYICTQEPIHSEPHIYIAWDNFETLNDALSDTKYVEIDLGEIGATRFKTLYKSIRGFHACRCLDPNSYYDRGILPLDREQAFALAKEIFNEQNFEEIDSPNLERALELTSFEGREQRTFFGLDKRYISREGSHYLTFGSEIMQVIAVNLKEVLENGIDYKETLKRIGTATVFECNLPLELISHQDVKSLVLEMTNCYFRSLMIDDFKLEWLDFTISLNEPLSPSHIVKHFTPDWCQHFP